MKRLLPWLGAAAGLTGRLAAATDTVLYPRAGGSAPAAGAPTGPMSLVTPMLVVLVGVAAGWILWRRLRSGVRASGGASQLAIAETRSLGNRQFLVVAAYGERRFLLGVCPGRIDLLAPLDSAAPPPRL